jgi:RNA polymerase sigma-70 factor, ECF subfamily
MENEKFIAEVYELYSKELYIYILRFTRSNETSEDILHDVFHNLITYAEKHTLDKDRVRAFLYKIAHNLCVNYKRKQSRIVFSPVDDAEHMHTANDADSKIESQELEKKIYQLLEKTDPVTRSIFIMKKEQNMNINEIAEFTGKSERTVRRRLQDVLSYLHTALKEGGFILVFFVLKMAQIANTIVL